MAATIEQAMMEARLRIGAAGVGAGRIVRDQGEPDANPLNVWDGVERRATPPFAGAPGCEYERRVADRLAGLPTASVAR